jgi:hypothetical protein
VLEPDWPRPHSMSELIENQDHQRVSKVKHDFESMSRDDYLTMKFQRLVNHSSLYLNRKLCQ